MPSIPHLAAPLSDGGVTLRETAERDIPEILIAYQDDPGLHVSLGEERPPSGAQLGRRAEEEAEARAAGRGATFTIVQAGSERFCGEVTVRQIEWEHDRAELRIWLAPDKRGLGIGKAALGLAARWLLHEAGLARVQLLIGPGNEPMLGAAHAAGFKREGDLREHLAGPQGRSDVVVYALLAEDRNQP